MSKFKNPPVKKGMIGDPSSKYGYDRDGSEFEADIQKHFEDAEKLWNDFVQWMKDNDITPDKLRWLWLRYYEEFVRE